MSKTAKLFSVTLALAFGAAAFSSSVEAAPTKHKDGKGCHVVGGKGPHLKGGHRVCK